jgi:hypothetical protein
VPIDINLPIRDRLYKWPCHYVGVSREGLNVVEHPRTGLGFYDDARFEQEFENTPENAQCRCCFAPVGQQEN